MVDMLPWLLEKLQWFGVVAAAAAVFPCLLSLSGCC